MKHINLKKYILEKNNFIFSKANLFQFDEPDETIIVVQILKECNQSVEDFIVQFLLVGCCEDNYMKEEYISIKDERMVDLDNFLFSSEVGGRRKFFLNPLAQEEGIKLLQEWFDSVNLIKLGISIDKIEYFSIIDEFDSTNQEMIFEDDKFKYYLSRGLG